MVLESDEPFETTGVLSAPGKPFWITGRFVNPEVVTQNPIDTSILSDGDIIVAKVEQFIGLVIGSYGETRGPGLLSVLHVATTVNTTPDHVTVNDGHGGYAYIPRRYICFVLKPTDPFYKIVKNIIK